MTMLAILKARSSSNEVAQQTTSLCLFSARLPVYPSRLPVCSPARLPVSSAHLPVYSSARLLACPSTRLPVYPSRLPVCPSARLPCCPPARLLVSSSRMTSLWFSQPGAWGCLPRLIGFSMFLKKNVTIVNDQYMPQDM